MIGGVVGVGGGERALTGRWRGCLWRCVYSWGHGNCVWFVGERAMGSDDGGMIMCKLSSAPERLLLLGDVEETFRKRNVRICAQWLVGIYSLSDSITMLERCVSVVPYPWCVCVCACVCIVQKYNHNIDHSTLSILFEPQRYRNPDRTVLHNWAAHAVACSLRC